MTSISFSNLSRACGFINAANALNDPIEITTRLMYALERLSEEFKFGFSHSEAIHYSFMSATSEDESIDLLESKEVRALMDFRPLIRSEDYNFYRSRFEQSRKYRDFDEFATSTHSRFIYAMRDSDSSLEDVELSLFKLLYVVRCNIAHGKKDPSVRNRTVCETINPLLWKILHMILWHPENRLLVYASASTGRMIADLLEPMKPVDTEVTIFGTMRPNGASTVFVPSDANQRYRDLSLEALLYENASIPSKWVALDQMEGDSKRRILVPYEHRTTYGAKKLDAAFIYIDSDQSESSSSSDPDRGQRYCSNCRRWTYHT